MDTIKADEIVSAALADANRQLSDFFSSEVISFGDYPVDKPNMIG
jgi:hypothetical protein